MRQFNLSANIETGVSGNDAYIVTPNVQKAVAEIVNQYRIGIHSFTIIGTYGTGKSCFLVNLEKDLLGQTKQRLLLKDPTALTRAAGFEILNIVGQYKPLKILLSDKLHCPEDEVILSLKQRYEHLKNQGKMFVIVIDEFGKTLEHAAAHNPEEELYFLQQLAEFANVPNREILLLTTLHQNFSAYASRLSVSQKNEWTKVKGRFHEVVFAEPVEQLLYMAAESEGHDTENCSDNIYKIAQASKFISPSLSFDTVRRLCPLDAFSATVITKAIQRYGQNERSLFTFLAADGEHAFRRFKSSENKTYSLSDVYDYLVNTFHSYLNEANADSTGWRAIKSAIERVETADWQDETELHEALKTVKAIGLLNLFGNAGFTMTHAQLSEYAAKAMECEHAGIIIDKLTQRKIIRHVEYKGRYILFEGTDFNIDEEIAKASVAVPIPSNPADGLRANFNGMIAPAKAYYYHRGTPRFFEYILLDSPLDLSPAGDIDGYIELVFSQDSARSPELVKRFSADCNHAVLFAVFVHTDNIILHLHKINIYDHILNKVLIDKSDRVAVQEISSLKSYEQSLLNKRVKEQLFTYSDDVVWFYKGAEKRVRSLREFNALLSEICDDVYPDTPVINNELINRNKLSGSISAARAKYLQALIERSDVEDLGFAKDKYPPEKTIYCTLLKTTGIHVNGTFADAPSNNEIMTLWKASEDFLHSTCERRRKVSELIAILSAQPYKIKAGVLDFWIPTYLFIKRLDYSLFGSNGAYIPNINIECFDLLRKRPDSFSVKAYSEDGIKMAFFNQYRKFIHADEEIQIKGDKFIETIRPFFFFYSRLNDYARHTRKFDHSTTLRFREVLAAAKDPEKTFFEDLPQAFGHSKDTLNNEAFVSEYCNLIQQAVRELRTCYSELINRLERQIVERLGLHSQQYSEYIVEIRERLSHIKEQLLSDKQLDFYRHAMTTFDNRTEWFQSISYAALDQPLERLRDNQEEQLTDNIVFLFKECEKCCVLSEAMDYRITESDKQKSETLENKIDAILTGNANLDIYTLMNLLKKKMQ